MYREKKRIKPPIMTVNILYVIFSFKYFLRIPAKITFISAESWKSYKLIRGHVVFLFTFDTCDVVHNWSIFLLPSIVLDNQFEKSKIVYIIIYIISNYKIV